MKPRHKPRPAVIYREEYQNELGEWVCSRMTYDEKQYDGWRELKDYIRKLGETRQAVADFAEEEPKPAKPEPVELGPEWEALKARWKAA